MNAGMGAALSSYLGAHSHDGDDSHDHSSEQLAALLRSLPQP